MMHCSRSCCAPSSESSWSDSSRSKPRVWTSARSPSWNRRWPQMSGADLAAVKARSLQTIGRSSLDEARQWLLVNFVQTYLPLRGVEERRYQEMLAREEHQGAKQVQITWGDRMR